MAHSFNGSTQALSASAAVLTAGPLTMAAWFYPTDNSTNQGLVCEGRSSTDSTYVGIDLRGDQGGALVHFRVNSTSVGNPASASGYTLNTWQHACGVQISATSRYCYLNGVAGTQDTTNIDIPAVINRFDIGRKTINGTPSDYFSGRIAEVALWSAALNASEIACLAKGFSPALVRPQSLAFYAPLIRNVFDARAGLALTDNGPTGTADHPPIIY